MGERGGEAMDLAERLMHVLSVVRDGEASALPARRDDRLSLSLSKAFLLAADTAITDESLLAHIRRGI
ncbi:hypothetical protein ACGFNY_20905 [Streptomyces chartreusis]|uniref:DUF7737 domain-containing protein n=1 Tax=Streptomyces chartreusis TaxID=1969 RepID=UPI00371E48FD